MAVGHPLPKWTKIIMLLGTGFDEGWSSDKHKL